MIFFLEFKREFIDRIVFSQPQTTDNFPNGDMDKIGLIIVGFHDKVILNLNGFPFPDIRRLYIKYKCDFLLLMPEVSTLLNLPVQGNFEMVFQVR